MFTGLVEESGAVHSLDATGGVIRLRIRSGVCSQDAAIGDSIAVNGACLTVVAIAGIGVGSTGDNEDGDGRLLEFDVLEETMRRTGFASFKPGTPVNLERSLKAGDRLGGHFVTGHVDQTGLVDLFEKQGDNHCLRIKLSDRTSIRYVVEKGSIAVDGISLTVAEVGEDSFTVWIIPHTLEVTNLRALSEGDPVNLEFDMIGKYVEKMLAARVST